MRVWIGCLACYNEGRLVGEWRDAIDADDVTSEDVHRNVAKDPAVLEFVAMAHEELWCMDLDETQGWLTEECSPMHAAQVARTIESIEDAHDDPETVLAWADNLGIRDDIIRDEYDSAQSDDFRDAYCGTFDSELDYAYELVDGTGMLYGIDEHIACYFDYQAFARDLFLDGHTGIRTSSGLAVFRDY